MAVFFACHLLTSAFAARKLHQTGSAARGAAWSGRPPGGGVRYRSPEVCGDQLGTGLASPDVSRQMGQ
jgi:hypothetical protein